MERMHIQGAKKGLYPSVKKGHKKDTSSWKEAWKLLPSQSAIAFRVFNAQKAIPMNLPSPQFNWCFVFMSINTWQFPAVWGLYLPNSRMVQVCNHKDFNVRDALQGVIQNHKGNICFHFSIMYFSIENVPRHCMQLKQVETNIQHHMCPWLAERF